MITPDAVSQEFSRRHNAYDPARQRMLKVRAVYNGQYAVPVEGADEPAVANLILTGVDQTAARIASIVPDIMVPAENRTDGSEKKAQRRKDVYKAWMTHSRLGNMMRKRARYLIAYGSAPAMITPDFDTKQPRWRILDPLMVFPSAESYDDLVPESTIVGTQRTYGWLRHKYPEATVQFERDTPDTAPVVVLDYSDAEQRCLVLHCDPNSAYMRANASPYPLEWVPNHAGCPLVVVPKRPVLDSVQGQFDQMIGMYEAQARLTALSLIATDKAVFPDTYLLSNPGELAEFVEGPHDGRSGMVNIVRGGTVTEMGTGPGFNTNPMIDRLERAQRIAGSVPAEFGGESQTNIRTGRRGDAILSATIDFPIMEAQEAFAEALTEELKIGTAISLGYWPNATITAYSSKGGKITGNTYVPSKLLTSDRCEVHYPVSGSDMNSLIVSMGQRIGLGTMSRRTASELDPLIDDPEKEEDRVTSEQLDTAVMAAVQQAAQQGSLPPQVISRVSELVRHDRKELADAVDQATKEYAEAQQREQQAQQEAALAQQMQAGAGMNPLMQQQGLGELVGAGPSVQESPQGMQNLAGMLRTIRNTSNYSDYQRGVGEPIRRGPERATA